MEKISANANRKAKILFFIKYLHKNCTVFTYTLDMISYKLPKVNDEFTIP